MHTFGSSLPNGLAATFRTRRMDADVREAFLLVTAGYFPFLKGNVMRVCSTSFLKCALVAMVVLTASLSNSVALGQEGNPRLVRPTSGSTAVPAEAGKLVAFEVTLVERAGEPLPGQKGKPPTPAQIAEFEKDSKTATVQRLQLVVLENVESRLQLGESAPMVTSRTVRTPREGGAAFGGGGGFPGTESVTYTEIGTMLSVTARVETDGKIVANLHVARTNLAPSKPAEKPDGQETTAINYPRKLTSTITTTARLVSGEPVVLAAQQSQASGTPSEMWVLVTAKVQ